MAVAMSQAAILPTPACDKMLAVQDESHALSEFLDWLDEHNLAICTTIVVNNSQPRWVPTPRSPSDLLADYFGIDLAEVEREKRAIIALLSDQCSGDVDPDEGGW